MSIVPEATDNPTAIRFGPAPVPGFGPGSGRAGRTQTIRRRGYSLLVVMVALSTSLVVTMAFLRTQTTSRQIDRNAQRRERAIQAARTGATVALRRIQSPGWRGVEEPLTRTVWSDESGTARYHVRFHRLADVSPYRDRADDQLPGDAAVRMVIRSTGIWEARRGERERVERRIEVETRLRPRLPDRKLLGWDSRAAEDRATNPADYEEIQQLALFAGGGPDSLSLGPGACIDGTVRLSEVLRLYREPRWSSRIRDELLASVGNRLTTAAGKPLSPHPLTGEVVFDAQPRPGRVLQDLDALKTPWSTAGASLQSPAVEFPNWTAYRVYENGFTYRARELRSGHLRDETLRPTSENPLGVFYRKGDLRLEDDVTVQGTLVVTGRLELEGASVRICSYNWRGKRGKPVTSRSEDWPRLPAIVARDVRADPDTRAMVEGALVVQRSVTAGGGALGFADDEEISFTGTASARPLRQPFSLVQIEDGPDLDEIKGDGRHALWIPRGRSGSWHPIVDVDRPARRLVVVGELEVSSREFRIRASRRRSLDVRGPVSGERHILHGTPAWTELSAKTWREIYHEWDAENQEREEENLDPIPFVEWLADPDNFHDGWGEALQDHGLRLQPTVRLQRLRDVSSQWSPPLFRAYEGEGPEDDLAGYRWQVVSWRELP